MSDNEQIKKGKNLIAKNGLLNSIKTLCSVVFPLITIPYITRVLGVANLGKYNFANSVISYFSLISSLGISTYAIRECSKVKYDRQKLDDTASELFSINICTMIISYALLTIVMLVYPKLYDYRLLISILSTNILLTVIGMDWINMAMEDFTYITLRTVFFHVIALLSILIFVNSTDDYIIYTIIMAGATGGANILNAFYVRKFCNIKFTWKFKIKRHMKPVLLVFSLLIAQNILSSLDITMLGILTNDTEVGLYSMSVKMYTTIERIISSIALVLLPQMSLFFLKGDFDSINRLLRKVWNFIYSFSIPFTVGLICLSTEFLGWICGEEFTAASVSLSILAISMFINLLGGSFWGNIVLLPSNREGRFMTACMISALCNAILNYYFIPVWGINGAAFATAVSATVIYIVCRYKKDQQINIYLNWKELVGAPVGGVLICVVCCFSKVIFDSYFIRIAFSILFGGISYFTVLMLFKNELLLIIKEKVYKSIRR